MNAKILSRRRALTTMLFAGIGFTACRRDPVTKSDPNVDYYTCTMHPSVRSQDPHGKCPICSMDLVPVLKKAPAGTAPAAAMGTPAELTEFRVPVERQQQIGVTYATVQKAPLRRTIRAAGIVAPDKARQWTFVARSEGYVQKLEVTSPGEPVREGQPLLTIYSPELLTAERELVNLLDTRGRAPGIGMDRLIEAARGRLEQWNVTADQIAELESARSPSEFLTLRSPFQGLVQEVPVEQGRRVMAGDSLMTVADLSVVWVWAEFYEEEIPILAQGQQVLLKAKAFPGETFEGRIQLIDPFLNEATRTARARIDIPNPNLKLRPGMYVDVELSVDLGNGLTIPVSAVMPTGERNLVFIDKGEGRLEPRFVELGGKFGDSYGVQGGLREGERVVASANFLIDAESKVQGAVKSFEKPGTP